MNATVLTNMEITPGASSEISEYFTPMEEPTAHNPHSTEDPKALTDLSPHTTDGLEPQPQPKLHKTKAPAPSRSFTNISRIEKIVDPLDPLVFSNLTITYSLIDTESEERKIDADYVPCYSNLSTSDSDISRVSRSRSCTRRSIDTVQRYSDNIIPIHFVSLSILSKKIKYYFFNQNATATKYPFLGVVFVSSLLGSTPFGIKPHHKDITTTVSEGLLGTTDKGNGQDFLHFGRYCLTLSILSSVKVF